LVQGLALLRHLIAQVGDLPIGCPVALLQQRQQPLAALYELLCREPALRVTTEFLAWPPPHIPGALLDRSLPRIVVFLIQRLG
jgi:hypothetical protein